MRIFFSTVVVLSVLTVASFAESICTQVLGIEVTDNNYRVLMQNDDGIRYTLAMAIDKSGPSKIALLNQARHSHEKICLSNRTDGFGFRVGEQPSTESLKPINR